MAFPEQNTSLRIISTVPSQTELLYDLGLNEEIVGITKFCVHPEQWFKTKTRIGGTKTLNVEKIKSLKPNLIIANKEENVKEQIEALADSANIFVSDVKTIQDNIELITQLGNLTNKRLTSTRLKIELEEAYNSIASVQYIKTAYLIWKDPYMTIGGDTYINSIMKKSGFQNIFEKKKRYPETTLEFLAHSDAELILLSSEPYPFKSKHLNELQDYLPGKKIVLVDGEAFSWYGTRLIKTAPYLVQLKEQINLV